jgi:hypothetical protein
LIENLIPAHSLPEHKVTLLEGVVKREVAPVVPTAILFGKLGVSAATEAAEFVRTAVVQDGQIDREN